MAQSQAFGLLNFDHSCNRLAPVFVQMLNSIAEVEMLFLYLIEEFMFKIILTHECYRLGSIEK